MRVFRMHETNHGERSIPHRSIDGQVDPVDSGCHRVVPVMLGDKPVEARDKTAAAKGNDDSTTPRLLPRLLGHVPFPSAVVDPSRGTP